MAVNQRVKRAVKGHVVFAPMFREQLEAIGLADPALFARTRAGLPATAKSTIALAFSSDGQTLASTHGDHTVKLVDVVASAVSAKQVSHARFVGASSVLSGNVMGEGACVCGSTCRV